MLSFLYVYSDHSILECYNLFSGVELSMRSFFVIYMDIDSLIYNIETEDFYKDIAEDVPARFDTSG